MTKQPLLRRKMKIIFGLGIKLGIVCNISLSAHLDVLFFEFPGGGKSLSVVFYR